MMWLRVKVQLLKKDQPFRFVNFLKGKMFILYINLLIAVNSFLVLSHDHGQVHFDCLYRGITAISSRESKLLAGNRSIAQVRIFYFADYFWPVWTK